MVEGRGDVLVPSVVVERGLFDFGMDFLDCWHDHCPEMLWFEDDKPHRCPPSLVRDLLYGLSKSAFLFDAPGLW